MEKQASQLKAGVALSYVNLALSSIIPFFYTPVMLRILGDAEYGLYSLSASVIGYLSLLSFGFGGTIVRYMTMYRALGEKEKEQKVFGFFILLYCSIAVVVMICGLAISNNIEPIFHNGLTDPEISKMRVLILIMSLNTALSFPVSVFTSVTMAHERFVFRRLVDMFLTIAIPMGNLVALFLGFASVGMAVSSVIIQLVMLPLNTIYCVKILGIRPRLSILPKELVQEMLGFSLFIFIGTIVDMLFWATDKVILGMLASTSAVAVYSIGGTFNSMVSSLSTSISGVLTPRITTMVVTEASKEKITALFIRVGRVQFLMVALVISGFTVFGRAFIRLWVGPSFAYAYWIAVLTLFPLCVPLIQNTGLSIVIAQNKHRFRSIVYLIIAIANVISTYLIVPYLGVIGAALCSGVSYIIGQGIIMNVYYYKVTGINIPLFWKNILRMSIIPGAMLFVGLVSVSKIPINNWASFFAGVIIFLVCYGVLMFRFAMNEEEKNLVAKPVNKCKNIFRRSK